MVGVASPPQLIEILRAVAVAVDAVGAHLIERFLQRIQVVGDQAAGLDGEGEGRVGRAHGSARRLMAKRAARRGAQIEVSAEALGEGLGGARRICGDQQPDEDERGEGAGQARPGYSPCSVRSRRAVSNFASFARCTRPVKAFSSSLGVRLKIQR